MRERERDGGRERERERRRRKEREGARERGGREKSPRVKDRATTWGAWGGRWANRPHATHRRGPERRAWARSATTGIVTATHRYLAEPAEHTDTPARVAHSSLWTVGPVVALRVASEVPPLWPQHHGKRDGESAAPRGGTARASYRGGLNHTWIYGGGEWYCLACLARRVQEDKPDGGKACPGVNPRWRSPWPKGRATL